MALTKPYTFSPTTTIYSAEVNSDFDTYLTYFKTAHHSDVDGTQIVNADISNGANIDQPKINWNVLAGFFYDGTNTATRQSGDFYAQNLSGAVTYLRSGQVIGGTEITTGTLFARNDFQLFGNQTMMSANTCIRFRNDAGNNAGLVWGTSGFGSYFSRISDESNLNFATDDLLYISKINTATGASTYQDFVLDVTKGQFNFWRNESGAGLYWSGQWAIDNELAGGHQYLYFKQQGGDPFLKMDYDAETLSSRTLLPFNNTTFNLGSAGSAWNHVYSAHFDPPSRRELKKNIVHITKQDGFLDLLDEIKPAKFTWKATNEDALGLIADEAPDLISVKDDKGVKVGWDLTPSVAFLIQVCKELKEELIILKK